MSMHTSPLAYRGVTRLRAEGDPNKILVELNKAFADFRAAHDEQLRGIDKRFADVVSAEKVDRINAAVGDLQGALDEANQRIAALASGGAGGAPGRPRDAEYTKAFLAHMRRGDVQASLNKGTASEGGYLTPVEWDRTITDRLVNISPMRAICRVQSISTGGFSKLFNNRGTASGWVNETAARTVTATPTFGTLTYTPGEIYANPSATQQLLDDAEVDIEPWLAGEVETEFAYQEGIAFVSGDGSNKPNGVLTYITGGANAAAHPWGAILTVNSGHASQVTSDGIVNLIYALPSQYTSAARFAMNRDTQNKIRLLKDGQGNYLWQPSYQAGQPPTLCQYPITELAAMPNVAAGTKPVLFGDFDMGYLIVDRIGVRVLRNPYKNPPYVEFYTTKRVGGGLLNPDVLKALNISA
ncbi:MULTISPECIES: phage major capsid protein [Methylosinus]|uniref:Phage major capsid protein n=1 Tax=Methylosinus trichosporium (strain ATCC 35070 / NCIMB 11131 / UNIQEM 75 / OB3b) TaxID=595536 RepID=A0A2D2CYC1_METT3|nr:MULTISPECIES: phage major capsid protein [Methylosinus]ATQ67742.1 phage major capsid protein [Methylosinus trichosporium OB3b]OBS51150.1 capsid protein [Methylosinus sp. 3S-1]